MRISVGMIAATAIVIGASSPVLGKSKAAHHAMFQLNSTSWTYKEDGKTREESIGPDGKYVTHAAGTHVDHGTAVMKDGMACFTSAMTSDGEHCWKVGPVAIGKTMIAVDTKGTKLPVTRVKYTPPKM